MKYKALDEGRICWITIPLHGDEQYPVGIYSQEDGTTIAVIEGNLVYENHFYMAVWCPITPEQLEILQLNKPEASKLLSDLPWQVHI